MNIARLSAAERRRGPVGDEEERKPEAPALTSAERLIALQASAGNAAAAQWVRAQQGPKLVAPAPVLQRGYLEQTNKKESVEQAVRKALGEVEEIDEVLAAVAAYEKLTSSSADALEAALHAVISAANDAKTALGGGEGARIMGELEAEAASAHFAVVKADDYAVALQKATFGANSELISAAISDIKALRARYGTKTGKSTQQPLYNFLADVSGKLAAAEQKRINEIGQDEYNFGDPATGVIDPATRGYLNAFDAIKKFLAKKPLVLQHLQPLAAPVNKAPDKLAALKEELRRKEAEAGFGAPKIPLGILPGEVFVSLLRDGTVLDDFGAGLQHGELSHRIQWYAIIDYMQGEGKDADGLKGYAPIDLFKKINASGFSPDRQGNTMWGSVLDRGTSASADSYSAPGTLNRDLLGASESFQPVGVGLAERAEKYKAPDEAKSLASIGDALIQLRELRMDQAAKLGGVTGERWQKYGVPTPELAQEIERSMSEGGGYAISDEGDSDGKKWKVLQEVTKTSEKIPTKELESVL